MGKLYQPYNNTFTHSNTVNGLITTIFYANQGQINQSYNPVKVTATADDYTTNNTESAYIQINKTSDIKISETTDNTQTTVQKTTPATTIKVNEKNHSNAINRRTINTINNWCIDDGSRNNKHKKKLTKKYKFFLHITLFFYKKKIFLLS
jgi:predicted transcriptional regulator